MKNQYFGDRRDFCKYELLLDLVACHGREPPALIPMLTPNDGSGEGNITGYECGNRRALVYTFLRGALAS